jgi:hypothetical protein
LKAIVDFLCSRLIAVVNRTSENLGFRRRGIDTGHAHVGSNNVDIRGLGQAAHGNFVAL